MGQPCASAKTEPSPNPQRQYLTSLSKWYPSHLSCCLISWGTGLRCSSAPQGLRAHLLGSGTQSRGHFILALFIYILICIWMWLTRYYLELLQPLCNYEGTNHLRIKLTWRYFLIYPPDFLLGEVTSIYYYSSQFKFYLYIICRQSIQYTQYIEYIFTHWFIPRS